MTRYNVLTFKTFIFCELFELLYDPLEFQQYDWIIPVFIQVLVLVSSFYLIFIDGSNVYF